MIPLRVNELKRFFSNSNTIKSNGILPVLDFILIDNDRIVKTNLNAYVEMKITPIGKRMLVDEKLLQNIVKITSADTIEVILKDKKVFLSDGKNKPFFTLSDDSVYPEFPDSEKENEVTLKSDVLKAVGVAVKNVNSGDVITPGFNFVNLAYGYVYGAEHNKFYFRKFDDLPTVLIDPLCANIISQFGEVRYYQRGNFDFYEVGSFLFGFAKTEATVINFVPFLEVISKGEYMEIYTKDLTDFLDLLSSMTPSLTTTVDFKGNQLSFYDVDLEVGNDLTLEVEGTYRPTYSFLPRILSSYVKSLNKEKIRISPLLQNRNGITIWDAEEENFIGMIGAISPL